jgi:TP901 family phage tail tape measure protein
MAGRTFRLEFEAITAQAERGFQKVASESKTLTGQLENQKKVSLEARDAALKLEAAQQRAARATARYGEGSLQAVRAQTEYEKSAKRLQGELDTTSRKAKLTGGALAGIGSTVRFAAATAGIAGLGIAVSKVASATIDFDKGMRNVNSIAQLSEGRLKQLDKQVLSLAGKTAQAPKTLAEGLYDLVSSGFSANQSVKILASSAKAATAGLTSTAVSTKAVAAVLNAYHRPAKDAAQISDDLFQTVNRGVISFEELATTIGDVLPFASSLGIGLKPVGAAISTMTKEGLSGAEATTRLKNTMVALLKPSDGMSAALKKLGYDSGESLIKAKGFQGSLEALIGTTDGTKAQIAQLFPNIRALGGALALTGANTKSAEKDLRNFKDTGGATDKALSQQSKSISYQWNQTKAVFAALAITLGTNLLPTVNSVLHSVSGFVQGMQDGTGAGGRFADTMRTVGGDLKPVVSALGSIVRFLSQHPRLLEAAAASFVIWRVAAAAASFTAKAKLIATFLGLGPKAAAGGAVAGSEFGMAANAAASRRLRAFKWPTLGLSIGKLLGLAIGEAAAVQISGAIGKALHYNPQAATGGGGGIKIGFGGTPILKDIPKAISKLNPFGATGGVIAGPRGAGDSVPMVLAPGEVVLNEKQQAILGYGNVMGALSATGGRMLGMHARAASGGLVGGAADLYGFLSRMGFRPTSTTGGVHAPNSYHYRGEAIDYGNSINNIPALANVLWPYRRQFAELFIPTTAPHGGLYHFGAQFSDPALQAEHQDHIHVADTAGSFTGSGKAAAGNSIGGSRKPMGKPAISVSKGSGFTPLQAQAKADRQSITYTGKDRHSDFESFYQAALINAQIKTPNNTADDLVVLNAWKQYETQSLNADLASGNVQGIIEHGGQLQAVQQQIDDITGGANGADSGVPDNSALLQGIHDQLADMNQRAKAITGTADGTLAQWVTEMIMGRAGTTVGNGSQMPSSPGVLARL